MNFKDAQQDLRQSYVGGASGVMISSLVWGMAAIVALLSTEQMSVLSLFLGGMLIHPLGIVVSKVLKRSGKHQKDNPLARLALESTFLLFLGLLIAFAVFQLRSNWFFPILLLIIGGRYLLFSTLYGMRIYWLLGMSLALAGIASLYLDLPFYTGAFLGGGIEMLFAGIIFYLQYSPNNRVEDSF
ncbi:hypothetical protein Q0590_33500 [Rhodocytophaga aerolata]|uniref:DUF308 domain-containing protein n=1 Tax=Rhodocytophaga aerolata TaxID=455078 RepID=A0ABT8RJ55_9BACT|nr:hypothetical protein [Rhodocytophaga aerolata]MDO1451238.1 hypothetical protein [Rhodocytophaga aerolata]